MLKKVGEDQIVSVFVHQVVSTEGEGPPLERRWRGGDVQVVSFGQWSSVLRSFKTQEFMRPLIHHGDPAWLLFLIQLESSSWLPALICQVYNHPDDDMGTFPYNNRTVGEEYLHLMMRTWLRWIGHIYEMMVWKSP